MCLWVCTASLKHRKQVTKHKEINPNFIAEGLESNKSEGTSKKKKIKLQHGQYDSTWKQWYIYRHISLLGLNSQCFLQWHDWTHHCSSLQFSNKEKNIYHLLTPTSQHNLTVASPRKKIYYNLFLFLYTIFDKPLLGYFKSIWKESFGSHSQSSHSKGQQWKAMRNHLGVWLTSRTTFCRAADTQERTKQNKRRKWKQWRRSFGTQTWIKHTRRRRTDQQHKRKSSVVCTYSLSALFLFMTNLITKNQY